MSWQRKFSHIYVERMVADMPLTQLVLARFSKAQIIYIDDYQKVFGRPGQDFNAQKNAPKLILAAKKDNFLYDGNEYVQDFEYKNFYYNALMLNCLYDCRYCYLQGMYRSANIVAFMNVEDYFEATREALRALKKRGEVMHLALSYDTDLMAFAGVIPYLKAWLAFIREESNLIGEVRTKSNHFSPLRTEVPEERLILAWTLSPEPIVKAHEPLTPSFNARLRSAREAQEAGWSIRLCFDPMLRVPGWQEMYKSMVEETFRVLDPAKVRDVSIGVLRMNADYFKKVKKMRRSALLHSPMERVNNTLSYREDVRTEMVSRLQDEVAQHISREFIHLWT